MKNLKIFILVSITILFLGAFRQVKAEDSPEVTLMKTWCSCQGANYPGTGFDCVEKTDEISIKLRNYCKPYAASCFLDTNSSVTDVQTCVEGFYNKASDKIKGEIISQSGVDSNTANKITEPCSGNLVCIKDLVDQMSEPGNENFGKDVLSTNATTQGPLTLNDLKGVLSTPNTAVNGVNNGAGSISAAGEDMLSKQKVPKVDINFVSDTTISDGAKVTANAAASLFNESPDNSDLYFTWYLKKANCDLSNDKYPSGICDENILSNKDYNDCKDKLHKAKEEETDPKRMQECDVDGDGLVTTNDWKITAARINIQADFDKSSADYSQSVDASLAGTKAIPSVNDDGWRKTVDPTVENTDSDDVANCYAMEPKSGIIYELRKVNWSFKDKPCPDTYHPACVIDAIASCDVADPADGTKTIKNDFGACQVVQDVVTRDSNGNVIDSGNSASGAGSLYYCDTIDVTDYKSAPKCDDGAIAMCVKDGDTYFPSIAVDPNSQNNPLLGIIFSKNKISSDSTVNDSNGVCSSLAKKNSVVGQASFLDNSVKFYYPIDGNRTPVDESCKQVISLMTNGLPDKNGTIIVPGTGTYQPTCTFQEAENECKHLFPRYPKNADVTIYDKSQNKFVSATADLSSEKIGDGKFGMDEKKFWGANPATSTTSANMKDEARVMGLGVNKFTWTYHTGDQIGVAVEGESMLNTDHADSSKKIMWAFSKNVCTALQKIDKTGFYIEDTGHNKQGILTANFDLDRCLKENLISPNLGDAQQFVAPKVTVNATPKNPINDPNGRGDTLNVSASVANMDNTFYKWQVFISQNGTNDDTTLWTDITQTLIKNDSFTADALQGINKSDFAMLLNIPDLSKVPSLNLSKYRTASGDFYIKIKATVTENNDSNNSASGDTVVKVIEQKNQIEIYPVSANADGKVSLVNSISGVSTELSGSECDGGTCYVTKNEIVGLKVPDTANSRLSQFTWKVNGNEFSCNSNISTDPACATPNGNELFFPVLGNVDEAIDVSATAKSCPTNGGTCQNIEISKHFVIVNPSAKIMVDSSVNTTKQVWPKVLGYYIDMDGSKIPDYSSTVMETYPGNLITLKAQFYPASNVDGVAYDWLVDGEQVDVNPAKPYQIQFAVDKLVGENYQISVSPRQVDISNNQQAINLRKALFNNWKIVKDDTSDANNVTAELQINVVEGSSLTAKANTGFFASLITHLPEQLMFLAKIALTGFTLLLSMSLLFAFMPDMQEADKRY